LSKFFGAKNSFLFATAADAADDDDADACARYAV